MSMSGFLPGYQSGSLGNIFAGLFGNAGGPYKDAMREYERYGNEAKAYQQPFYQAGQGAIGDFQSWLQGQKDPSAFINNLMGQYQESPYARYEQQQAMRAGTNAASASGLIGSTPFQQQAQQNAANISSQDMNQWLQNVLGINTQYGAGQQSLMQGGQSSANALTQLMQMLGQSMGEARYGKKAAEERQRGSLFQGITGLFGL